MNVVRQLLRLIRPVCPSMLAALLLSALCQLSSVGLMATAAWLIAAAALHPMIYELSLAIVGVRCFGIARAILRYGERYVSHDATFRILGQLRALCYTRLEALVPARQNGQASGELCGLLLQQVDTLKDFYLRVLAPACTALLVLLVVAVGLSFYTPWLAVLIATAFLLIGLAIPAAVQRQNRQNILAAEIQQTRLRNQCIDAIHGIAELTAANQTSAMLEKLKATARQASAHQNQAFRISALSDSLAEAVGALTITAALCCLIPLVRADALTGIQLAVCVLTLQSSFEAAFALPAAWQYWITAQSAASRLFARSEPIAPANAAAAARLTATTNQPPLTVQDLHFSYPGGAPVLAGLSFTLQPGERLAIVGSSGAGKSTLFALLLHLYQAQSGSLNLNGIPYAACTPAWIRAQFNVVMQTTHIFHQTLADNLQILHPGTTTAEMRAALDKAELGSFIAALPNGLDTAIGQNGKQLSGGQRQRLSLGRALLKPAPILLLDEPATGLDRPTAAKIMQSIYNLPGRQSMILITHDLNSLDRMDRILVLDHGKIAEAGSYQALVAKRGLFYQLLQYS